jgi:hypothetical protein
MKAHPDLGGTYRAFIKRYFPVLPPAQYEPFVEWRARVGLSGEFDRYAMTIALTYQMSQLQNWDGAVNYWVLRADF